MMLSEVAGLGVGALPIAAFKTHLRMGTGFADDAATDAAVEAALRAALAAVEARTGKALVARNFRLVVGGWRDDEGQALPLAPVRQIVSVTMMDRAGAAVAVPATATRLVRDLHRPRLAPAGSFLPVVPGGGSVEIVFEAGFGVWGEVPSDLQQAVFLLGARYYDDRSAMGAAEAMPFGILALIERWRNVRVLGGGAR